MRKGINSLITIFKFILLNLIIFLLILHIINNLLNSISVMLIACIAIILSGVLFGKKYAFISAYAIYILGYIFIISKMDQFNNPRFIVSGFLSYTGYAFVGLIIRSMIEMNSKIKRLVAELNIKNKELTEMAIKDPLTNLYNRRYASQIIAETANNFLKQLTIPEVMKRNTDSVGKVMLIILIDIDHFKKVNDTYGHDIGDKVLVSTSSALKESVRFDDSVIRWGGEEFLIVCQKVNKSNIVAIVDKILNNVRDKKIDIGDGKNLGVTISAGVVSFPSTDQNGDMTFEYAVNSADKALYEAKENGRNQAVYVK